MTPTTSFITALARLLGRPVSWANLCVLRNFGSLRLGAPMEEGAETHGFHARLLDGDGRCTHYVKCRSAASANAAREATVLSALQLAPALAGAIPPVQVMRLPGMTALVLGVVEGPSFTRRVGKAPLAEAIADSRRCLAVRQRIFESASATGMLGAGGREFHAQRSLEPSLRVLEERRVPADLLEAIRTLIPPNLPLAPQHGDFTPANIIWSPSGPVVLDFEFFGLVTTPLYDAWHFIRNARVQRREAGSWLGVVAPRNRRDAAWRGLLEEQASHAGLSEPQVAASLVWYLSHISALIIARQNSDEYCRPYLDDLTRAGRLVAGTR